MDAKSSDQAAVRRVAIVVGANLGEGPAVARALAADGFAIAVVFLSEQAEAETLVEELLDAGGAAVAIRADAEDELDAERLVGETRRMFGAVDVVIHVVPGPGADQGVPRGRTSPAGANLIAITPPKGAPVSSVTDTSTASNQGSGSGAVDLKLEAVVIPVADVDRAKAFYTGLGWRLDADFPFDNGFRVVQLTPPGSGCSVQFGAHITSAAPGSGEGLYLIVSDIDAAREELAGRGVSVSEVFHPGAPGAQFQADGSDRVSGRAPDGGSYGSFATFADPDGNRWLIQEVTTRLPGRVAGDTTFASAGELSAALQRAAAAHGEHEARTGKADAEWPAWYAEYMVREQAGEELPT